MPLPLPVGAVIEVTIPTEVSIYSDVERTNLILNSAVGYNPVYSVPTVQVLDTVTQRISVSNLVPSSQYYVDQNNYVKFGVQDMKNPETIQTTPEFAISIYDEDDIIIEVDPNGLTYTAQPGRLENIQIFPENYKTRQSVPYEFSFETKNTL